MRSLVNDRSIVIKNDNTDFCVIVSDCKDYMAEAEKQLVIEMFIRTLILKKNFLQELEETSNRLFTNLKRKGCITE